MRLSRLNIAGFKSFPDRSELGFDNGVTAIVGPNGCGKSNVVDAITWVLGEQSAKSLRGERMEDVIFNGSEARKPTSTAEVRLKFTQVAQAAVPSPDGDADPLLDEQPLMMRDVEIGRRLYRSGESEYLIDGEACRLRDIHDLLMDSGLGVKAYAVIEQGKIGQILSSRPAERRMLIEEAAGVTKYKSRRRSAELKLEAAQGNLTRVDDIVFEVEKQRGALKRQAARARRYKRLREELRKWEQVQFARRYEALSADIAAADARLSDTRVREAAAAAHVAELEGALEALRLGFAEAESIATATREQAHAHELEIGRRQQQIQFDRLQIEELGAQAATFEAEARELEARRSPAAEAIALAREAASRARSGLEDAGIQVKDRELDYGRAIAGVQAVEGDADAARAAVMAASTALSALRQARDHAAAVRDRVAAERERLEAEARDLTAEADRANMASAQAREALEEARSSHGVLLGRRREAEETLSARRADRERAAQALSVRERELAGTEARLRSLEELEARRATFGDAARLLLAEPSDTLRQRGAVADHLRVERSFERAVDALLGDLLQYVLVDRAEDVNVALDRVRQQNAGRCGFLVLEDADGEAPSVAAPIDLPAGVHALAAVVRAEGPFADAVARLIGPALVVDDFEQARDLARTTGLPVATRSGEVFRHRWLVQGGSRQDVRGILETRAEMVTLREQVEAGAAALSGMTADLAELAGQISTGQALLTEIIAEQHDREKAIVGFEAQTNRSVDDRQRVLRRLDVVATELSRARQEVESTERRREEAASAIVTHEAGFHAAEDQLSGVLGRLQQARETSEVCMRQVSESRTAQATLVERVSGVEAELTRLEEAARDLGLRLDGRRADMQRTEVRRDQLRQGIADSERALDEGIRALEQFKIELRDRDERVATLRDQMSGREQAIRGARHSHDEVRSAVLQSEVARATATADLTHLESACVEAVGASLDDVAGAVIRMRDAGELVAPSSSRLASGADESDEDDETALESAAADEVSESAEPAAADAVDVDGVIQQLRQKIDRLGPVNMMAIEQFDELESRHLFLTTQRKDLLDSIAQTGEAIRKIDKTTRERFAEAFESINRHFEQTFTTLFGGGRAGLLLIDHENDTESGIDIIAQPPGKRLQNVQLLSGGEKALTAMALMFAVFKHRPSPFCLLDEIDAPLDDANIGRFVEMLQGMQTHTQFILITHNRKTMEIADRLYGVTMEEPGVSKLISLQLN
ncbi:MAG: chromosome segregation protein SMC [Vicinamibacterales bacterium]